MSLTSTAAYLGKMLTILAHTIADIGVSTCTHRHQAKVKQSLQFITRGARPLSGGTAVPDASHLTILAHSQQASIDDSKGLFELLAFSFF